MCQPKYQILNVFKIKVVFTPSSYNVSASSIIIYNQTVCPFQYIQIVFLVINKRYNNTTGKGKNKKKLKKKSGVEITRLASRGVELFTIIKKSKTISKNNHFTCSQKATLPKREDYLVGSLQQVLLILWIQKLQTITYVFTCRPKLVKWYNVKP